MFGADAEEVIRADASAHLQRFDLAQNLALFIHLDEAAYRAASFLDDRIITPETQGSWIKMPRLFRAVADIKTQHPLHFIFHAGHVGSTLISRLLDEIPGVLGLREPQTLRQLAQLSDDPDVDRATFQALLDAQIKIWRRGFADTHHVVLKATSSASRLAEALLASAPDARAVFLNLRAEPYLATYLAGANTPTDVRTMAGERLQRLSRLAGASVPAMEQMSLGELCAMSWLAETLTHQRARAALSERALMVDFEDFLGAPGVHIGRTAAHFGIPTPADIERRIEASPALRRYSKAPEHEYSPGARAAVLSEARAEHAQEIRKGLDWINRIASAHPSIANALTNAR